MHEFAETLYDSYGQAFRVDELLYEVKTGHQHLIIFHNATFGRVLVLDGVIQTTEKDEFIYHEMMAHVPILAHGRAKRVLIIGGGDGGMDHPGGNRSAGDRYVPAVSAPSFPRRLRRPPAGHRHRRRPQVCTAHGR